MLSAETSSIITEYLAYTALAKPGEIVRLGVC